MDDNKEIIIEIDENGKITADAIGFKGDVCLQKIKEILKNMPPIDKIDKKPDFFEESVKEKTESKLKVKGGK